MECKERSESLMSIPTLINVKTRKCYDILNKKTHQVGRAGFGADLEISNDTSISRCHADLILEKKTVGNSKKLLLILVDKKSKYGTFINAMDKKIESNCPKILKLGDKIRFGIMDSIWTVEEYPLVVCPSTLKSSEKNMLTLLMTKLGGRVVRDWSEECSHLCMNSVTVTEKVLLCLASGKSIVSIRYFTALCSGFTVNLSLEIPYCMDYTPKLVEGLLNPNSLSLNVNNRRKTLFSGKTFICSTVNQLNRLSKLVKLAGGEIMIYSDGILSDDDILSDTKYILMQQDPCYDEDSNTYQQILEKLKMMNRRSIPENDIGFAIIFSNTIKHCNPNFNVSLVNLESQSNVIKSQESIVLAPETEILTCNDGELFSVNTIPDSLPNTIPDSLPNIIPDSLPNTIPDSLSNTQSAFKRQLEVVSDSEEMPTKRSLLANNGQKNNSMESIRIGDDLKSFQCVNEPTPSSSNHNIQSPTPKTQTVNNGFTNDNLCLTTVLRSQNISNANKLSAWLQSTVADDNVHDTNNLQSTAAEIQTVPTKRKISNDNPVFNNENEDPFNYMDIDEVEDHPKKKPKKRDMDSLFFPTVNASSSNKSEPSKKVETNVNVAVDPNFIMNLLSEAKGTGQFIDASMLHNKSSANTHEDTESDYLLNSVIVETVSMVVSRPIQTANIIQGNNNNLKNFKKFKKKGPTMRIPYIVPMEFTQID